MKANETQNAAKATLGLSFKKKILLALVTLVAVVGIVSASVFATVAYLTSSAAVSNVFTIGSVGITMTESKVNSDGTLYDGGTTRVDTNTYHLVPDSSYNKDPIIYVNAQSEKSYLFVLVRNDIEAVEVKDDSTRPTIAQQLAALGWAKYTQASTGWVYVYVGAGLVDAADAQKTDATSFSYTAKSVVPGEYPVFEEFHIANVSEEILKKYAAAKITLTAVAIQSSNFANIDEAWTAVTQTYPYIHTGTKN